MRACGSWRRRPARSARGRHPAGWWPCASLRPRSSAPSGEIGQPAHAAEIDLLAAFVGVQGPWRRSSPIALPEARSHSLIDAQQVAAQQGLAVGMKLQRVDVTEVPGQLADQRAARRLPEPDRPVVAAGGEQLAVGADAHGADPAPVGLDRPDRLGRGGGGLPDDDSPVAAAAVGRLAVGRERQREDPRIVPAREGDLLAVGQVERAGSSSSRARRRRSGPSGSNRQQTIGRSGRPLGHHVGLLGIETGRVSPWRCTSPTENSHSSATDHSRQDRPDHLRRRVGDRDVAAFDLERVGRVDAHGLEVGVEEVGVIDLAVDDLRPLGVRLAVSDAAVDLARRPSPPSRRATSDRGRSRWLMFGVRPNSERTTIRVLSSIPRSARSATNAANDRSNSPSCSMWKLKFSLCVS